MPPHLCYQCGAEVDCLATHGLSCRWSLGRHSSNAILNDIIHRALITVKIPSRLEPSEVYHSDGKRPDGASLVPWKRGKVLVWDATCEDTFAPSYISKAAMAAGLIARHAGRGSKLSITILPPPTSSFRWQWRPQASLALKL